MVPLQNPYLLKNRQAQVHERVQLLLVDRDAHDLRRVDRPLLRLSHLLRRDGLTPRHSGERKGFLYQRWMPISLPNLEWSAAKPFPRL